MDCGDWTRSLFDSIDCKNVEAFLEYLCDDAVFRFANSEPVKGKPAIREAVQGFFASVQGLSHELLDTWSAGDARICHGTVTYTRHDSSTLTIPFANILKLRDDRVSEYLIFVDASKLYGSG